MQSLLVLGRQPALGLAELESLYGADKLQPIGQQTVIVDVDPCLLAFDRLGGSIKFCKILATLDTTDWKEIEKFLIKSVPEHAKMMPEGKMTLGLSVIDLQVSLPRLQATGLTLKKLVRKSGRPVRLVPNPQTQLNSAQVLHNKLTSPNGWELIFVKHGQQTILAQTVKVQDIESYTLRDRGRPKRDSRVGMLPPKLAQIIINLATGQLPADKLESVCETPAGQPLPRPFLDKTVLDPFCGTGVLLQEAALMGYHAYGSDLEPRMVHYSEANLKWLAERFPLPPVCCSVEQGDATTHQWQRPVDFVACESYLGRPFTSTPSPETLAQTVADCNLIIKKFLANMHDQIKPGTRLCLAVPAWQTRPNQFKKLPLIDQISNLGYNRVVLESVREDLIYFRENQVVARQLLLITRK